MGNDNFLLRSIQDLLEHFFFIPRYQRGYRWGTQQVLDLLNDIGEVDENDPLQKYCLQPLVVARRKGDCFIAKKGKTEEREGMIWYLVPSNEAKECNDSFEVIDGQQRLTTIFIILKYLDVEKPYNLEYETRKGSQEFLLKISKDGLSEENIDFQHMTQCYRTVDDWFQNRTKDLGEEFREKFRKKLLTKVYFIWYEDDSDKPVETFTRLNIGKIALTNAELIKAMLLKQSNFKDASSNEAFRLTQLEMATQWDEIEYTLQNDEFWYFIHPQEWKKPTRIDFVFELLKELNLLKFDGKDLGNDNYTTFRYFYQYLQSKNGRYDEIWTNVRTIFQIFREWFHDATFYHYVGFLAATNCKISALVMTWNEKDKTNFRNELINNIKENIPKNLTQTYENKRECNRQE